ncbi:hypothetical protein DFP72DRAFT_272287 [Ephemerocybe angulata]|uniref:Uncharacterized protein n=1 Tax=Ephemerocybe angulata TaxID=980116 RepID=A0A8H6MA18_9AGAR|nr:hypothetical protein DFP72DRAFT_272287 [Tulosesus angulatus]
MAGAAGVGAGPVYYTGAVPAQQERRKSKLERRHLGAERRTASVGDGGTWAERRVERLQERETLQQQLMSVPHAPGRLNVDELQAQARAGGTASTPSKLQQHHRSSSTSYLPTTSSELKGWSTRTDRNLKQMSWRDDDDLGTEKVLSFTGGGAVKRQMPFQPVIMDDYGRNGEYSGLRGVEGVQQYSQRQTHRMSASVVDLGVRGDGERDTAKLRKEKRSSSVDVPPVVGGGQRRAMPASASSQSQQGYYTRVGGGYGSDTASGAVGRMDSTASKPRVIRQQRSISLTSAPPGVASVQQQNQSQNQYGATILSAGGSQPSGTLSRGGWGASGGTGASLSRNTSVMSAASAPAGGQKTRAQGSLGQGMGMATNGRRTNGTTAGASSSMVDISRVGPPSRSGTLKGERRISMPQPVALPGVPGAVSASMPLLPRAPPPVSMQTLQSTSMTSMMPAKGDASLVSIIEDIARGNRIAEEQIRVLKSGGKMDLHVMPAPVRVPRQVLTGPGPEPVPRPQVPVPYNVGGGPARSTSTASGGSGGGEADEPDERVEASSGSIEECDEEPE